ncbi:hypothetical protein H0H93_004973 [Arthromyces matolae]|nr:hypothetical protein H0H93_004973 [Arthromyces matolae]
MPLKKNNLESQIASDLKNSLSSAMSKDSSLTPHAAMIKITQDMLKNNPFAPPVGCPVNALPPELLAHIFLVGATMEAEGENEDDIDDDFDDEEFDVDLKDGWTDEEDVDPEELDDKVVERLKAKGKVTQKTDGAMDIDDEGNDSNGDETDSDNEDEDTEKVLPFQVLVSHVCQHWREVALETPTLWTTLTFSEGAPFERSRTWIQRAKGSPLDIHIDCTIPDVGEELRPFVGFADDEEEHEDWLPPVASPLVPPVATPATHGQRYVDKHASCNHDPPTFSLPDLQVIMDMLVPLVSQWRSLEVTTSAFEYVHTVLSRLSQCPSAPLLETLEFYHYEDVEDYEVFSPAEFRESFLIFNGNAPNLRDVALWGVHLDWDRSISLLSNLRDFELTYHAEDVRPSFDTFAQIIKSSPNLRTLSLCLSGPQKHDSEENNWGMDSENIIEVPSLKDLVFSYHTVAYGIALLKKLSVPNVHSLALDFDGEDFSDFVKQLILPMPKSTKSILTGLEHIKISGLPCDRSTSESMLRQLVNLKTFNINCMNEEEHDMFRKLFPSPPSGASSSSSAARRIFCPNLYMITTSGIPGEEMRAFVEARASAGVPIKRVMMSEEDDVDERDAIWLRAHVEELDFFEPSDSEEEFDDDDSEDEDFGMYDGEED